MRSPLRPTAASPMCRSMATPESPSREPTASLCRSSISLLQKVIGTVDFGHGVRPHCAVYDPVSKLLYVTTEIDKSITIIDPKTLKIVGSIPTGEEYSHMLAISHDGPAATQPTSSPALFPCSI